MYTVNRYKILDQIDDISYSADTLGMGNLENILPPAMYE